MVSLPTRGTSRRFTASWATNRTAQRARPSGGALHTMAMIRCFLAVVQNAGGARALLVIQCRFETARLVPMADFANGLWGERDNAGNARCAGAFGQLQQRQGAQDDPNLLHPAAQQTAQFLLVLLRDLNTQG